MTRRTRILCATAAMAAVVFPGASFGGDVLSVKEFLETKERWSNFAAVKIPLKIEGRLGSYSPGGMRFRELPLSMSPEVGEQLPAMKGVKNVEVSARLVRKGNRFALTVSKVEKRPSDVDAFKARIVALPIDRSELWYEAGRWAERRATFYGDAELRKLAQNAYLRGVQMELLTLKGNDVATRLQLAASIRERKLPDALSQNLVHEAFRIRWSQHRRTGEPSLPELKADMKRDLPGCERSLEAIPVKLQQSYRASPAVVYNDADAAQRNVLHRLFYIDVLQSEIEADLKKDGSNGFAIAEKLDKQIPELADAAEAHRIRELDHRFANITGGTRSQAVELAETFRKRNDDDRAAKTLERWLKAQEPKARLAGADALVALADDAVRLADDKPRAIALLKEAHRQDARSKRSVQKLEDFGYALHNNEWVLKSEIPKQPVDPLELAMREGRVLKGMTADQVRRAMAGRPDSVARSIVNRTVTEVWIYRRATGGRTAVHFQRPSTAPSTNARVAVVTESRE